MMAIPKELELTARFEEIYFESARRSTGVAHDLRERMVKREGGLTWLDLYGPLQALDLGDEVDLDVEDRARAEEAVERVEELFAMFLQAVSAADVFAAMTLEAHVNCVGAGQLESSEFDVFDRLSLEGKWLFLPKLLGKPGFDRGARPFQDFKHLINRRNRLVHMRPGDRLISVTGGERIDEFLNSQLIQAQGAVEIAQTMVKSLANRLGSDHPPWAHGDQPAYYELRPSETGSAA